MKVCHRSPLNAILDAFTEVKLKSKQEQLSIDNCHIIELPYVFDRGVGSIVMAIYIDGGHSYVGYAKYCNN
jgi:hypothetical protein